MIIMATPYTDEEMNVLRSNPYTYKVTRRKLCLTAEFKELFYKEYREGGKPRDIFEKCGFPEDIITSSRAAHITSCIKREYSNKGYFSEGNRADLRESAQAEAQAQRLRQLEQENEYLRQKVEFLKKISEIRTTGK